MQPVLISNCHKGGFVRATAERRNDIENSYALPPPLVVGMPRELALGDVLIKPGAELPPRVHLQTARVGGWDLLIGLSARGFEQLIGERGWHLFFLVRSLEASGLATNRATAMRKAIRQVVETADAAGINAVEVREIRVRKVIPGLYWARVRVRKRHIRPNPFYRDHDPGHEVRGLGNGLEVFEAMKRIGDSTA